MTACVRKVSEETELQCWNCVTTLTAQNHMTRGHGVKDECSIWENRLSFLSGGELNEHVGTAQTFLHCGYYIFIKQATWGANKYIFVTFLIKLRQLFPSVSSLWAKLHIKAATTDFQLISAPPLDRGGSVSIASGRKRLGEHVYLFWKQNTSRTKTISSWSGLLSDNWWGWLVFLSQFDFLFCSSLKSFLKKKKTHTHISSGFLLIGYSLPNFALGK